MLLSVSASASVGNDVDAGATDNVDIGATDDIHIGETDDVDTDAATDDVHTGVTDGDTVARVALVSDSASRYRVR